MPAFDSFTRGDESPMTTGWTQREAGELNLVSNEVTNAGEVQLGFDERRLYTCDTAGLDTDGTGIVSCRVKFSSDAGDEDWAGVVGGWSAGNYYYAWITPVGNVFLGSKSVGLASDTASITHSTWYTLALEIGPSWLKVYIDGALALTYNGSTPLATQVAGIMVRMEDIAACTTYFDNFAAIPSYLQTRQFLGTQIVRAGDGTAKLRTPFATGVRRKLSLDMQGTGEWMKR